MITNLYFRLIDAQSKFPPTLFVTFPYRDEGEIDVQYHWLFSQQFGRLKVVDEQRVDGLCAAIEKEFPKLKAKNYHTLPELATFCKNELKSGDVLLTLGAGDIYHVHELIAAA